ncbi:MAG TPA: hypothetical protein VGE00_00550 [Gammaproteobacteria bacterium]
MKGRSLIIAAMAAAIVFSGALHGEWSGSAALEARLFPEAPVDPLQQGSHGSVALAPEYHQESGNGRQGFTFTPFARLDSGDPERTHADLREMLWHFATDEWELRTGVGKVFWGVTEAQHLVDIINQTDLVEDIDGEEKLGQPMLNIARISDWGSWQLFVLPYFRERTFPGVEGRLRPQPAVDSSGSVYESSAREHHVDWAARWSHYLGAWDLGLSWFSGTSREPLFLLSSEAGGTPRLMPYYPLIEQAGLDLQFTHEAWLWKLEGIHRAGFGEAYSAMTGGFEYAVTGIAGSRADLGYLAEYLYDDRGERATTPFEDDLFLGLRLAFNDTASSDLLIGIICDDDGSTLYSAEASRRMTLHTVVRLEARAFSSKAANPLATFEKDDYLQMQVHYYF